MLVVLLISYVPRNTSVYSSSLDKNTAIFIRPDIIFGHVHVAKTGGSTINGILANKFEFVCGNKGNSFDAYRFNELAKHGTNFTIENGYGRNDEFGHAGRDRDQYGYEDCDYISREVDWSAWTDDFEGGKLHNITMELHVPCRDPLEHLMSQCNYRGRSINCGASSDEEFLDSVDDCVLGTDGMDRYSNELKKHFPVKCFDFKKSFTTYVDYMSTKLVKRRFESSPYKMRATNEPRNKDDECLWKRPDLMKIARAFLLHEFEYYQFCEECIGSENEITRLDTDALGSGK